MEKYKQVTHPICAAESIVQGDRYRISILTPELIRLEYSEDQGFEDRPTQMVYNRNFPPVSFRTKRTEGQLEIFTDKVHITYNEKEFSGNGLKIVVSGGFGWGSTWRYGDPASDLGGTARTLDEADGEIRLESGVNSGRGFSVIDDSHSMALTEDGFVTPRTGNRKDLYFFGYGTDFEKCIRDFYYLCGPTPLLPRFALGNWWSRYHPYTETEYKELMERFESEKLPFSVAVIDMDWHLVNIDPKYGSGWTGYTWNRELFPDPREFMSWLHEHNLKISLNVHPADGIRAHEDVYPEMAKAMGIDPATEEPVEFDAASPKFLENYFEKVHHPLEEEGVDFWWLDWQQGNTSKIPGLDPLWMLNHYHYLDSAHNGKRALTFSRYAGPGSHRYPVGFSGDTIISWASLKFQPYFTSTASNIGYGWWSHDIGGHMLGARDDELAARWVQLGAFSPINRLHSSFDEFSGKEPWKFGRDARASMEKFLRLRHAMVPYLYTMNKYAHDDGQPLVRPLYWKDPSNRMFYYEKEFRNEYYFGTEMLVAPITDPEDPKARLAKAKTWMPAGDWFDFFSGTAYHGGRAVNIYRSLDDMPVFVKAGGIIPLQAETEVINSISNPEAFVIHVFPGADGSFTIWEDRDEAVDREENWVHTDLTWKTGNGKSVFTIAGAEGNLDAIPEKRSYKLYFRSTKDTAVTVTGAEAKVSYCEKSRSVVVELSAVPVTETVKVIFSEECQIADNRLTETIWNILNMAQIPYIEKMKLYRAVQYSGASAIASVMADATNETVQGAIVELLTAW